MKLISECLDGKEITRGLGSGRGHCWENIRAAAKCIRGEHGIKTVRRRVTVSENNNGVYGVRKDMARPIRNQSRNNGIPQDLEAGSNRSYVTIVNLFIPECSETIVRVYSPVGVQYRRELFGRARSMNYYPLLGKIINSHLSSEKLPNYEASRRASFLRGSTGTGELFQLRSFHAELCIHASHLSFVVNTPSIVRVTTRNLSKRIAFRREFFRNYFTEILLRIPRL